MSSIYDEMKNPEYIQLATDELLTLLYDEAKNRIEELEAALTAIRQEFGARLELKKQDSQIVDNGVDKWTITPFMKINVKDVTEETAKNFGAWKKVTTFKVDSAVVKALIKKKIDVPGARFEKFVRIDRMEEKDNG